MYMSEDSFLKKPKYVVHIRRQKILSENTFVMEGSFFLLSITTGWLTLRLHRTCYT